MHMCILEGVLDTLSRDKTLKSELPVCFYTIVQFSFIMVYKIFFGNWPF